MNKRHLRLITNDLFSIADRIKSIDDSYQIYYNGEKQRFEVYGGKGNILQVVLPYNTLDCRSLDYVRNTRIERIEEMLEQVDRHNREIEKNAIKDAVKTSLVGLDI